MRAVFKASAIVAAFVGAASLAGCGNRGPLYLPQVPPLPEAPPTEMVPASPTSDDSSAATTEPESLAVPSETIGAAPLPDGAASAAR